MSTDIFQRIAQRIQRRMQEAQLPSVAFAIATHGRIVHEQALGFADRERKTPATTDTLYGLASISKPLTAIGIMKLVEQGLIDLDIPVNHYLNPHAGVRVWIGEPGQVTVRRVLQHTAGLPTYSRYFRADETIASLDESIARYANVFCPAGERFVYSNVGYAVLARVIERVSGQSYAQYMAREIFRPLGMTHALIGPPASPLPSAAVMYDWENKPATHHDAMATDHAAASSAMCSIHDLIRLGLFFQGHRQPGQEQVLSPATMHAMVQSPFPVKPNNTSDFNMRPGSQYGLGWVVNDDELDTRISHAGGMEGCASKLLMLPKEQVVIALLGNVFNKSLYTLENDILEELIPSYVGRLNAHQQRMQMMQLIEPPAAALTQGIPGRWHGEVHTYEGRLPIRLIFSSAAQGQAELHGQPAAELGNVQCSGLRVQATFQAELPTSDTRKRVRLPGHHVKLDVFLRHERLLGVLYSMRGNLLNHWVELSRES